MNSLNRKAFGGLLFLVLGMVALLFIPAGTLGYWEAWLFLAVYFALSLAITLYLMKHDPKLLARRMSGGPTAEKEPARKEIHHVDFAAGLHPVCCSSGARSSLRVVAHAAVYRGGRRRANGAWLVRHLSRVQGKHLLVRDY